LLAGQQLRHHAVAAAFRAHGHAQPAQLQQRIEFALAAENPDGLNADVGQRLHGTDGGCLCGLAGPAKATLHQCHVRLGRIGFQALQVLGRAFGFKQHHRHAMALQCIGVLAGKGVVGAVFQAGAESDLRRGHGVKPCPRQPGHGHRGGQDWQPDQQPAIAIQSGGSHARVIPCYKGL
jgi:hypothetical protein